MLLSFTILLFNLIDLDLSKAPILQSLTQLKWDGYSPFFVCAPVMSTILEVKCESLGLNKGEGPKAELRLRLKLPDITHEYGLRHGILAGDCNQMARRIKAIINTSDEFCIAGEFAEISQGPDEKIASWIFFELVTDKGSVCDHCEWPAKL